jgi:hypothetical protein
VWFGGSGFSFSFDSGVDAPDGSSGVYRFFEASGGNGFAEFGQLGISGPNPVRVIASFSFSSESFDSVDAGIDNTSVTSLPNGWFRISATAYGYTASIHVKDAGHGQIGIDWATNNDYIRFTLNDNGNDIVQGVYIWGAQLEQRDQVTAYTPTTDQPISNYIPVLKTAAPNEPRFDHDPVTGESKGLLIEEQRTNLIEYSQDFFDPYWVVNSTRIILNESDVATAPDGTKTAAKIVATDVDIDHFLETGPNNAFFESGKSYTLSVFVKPNDFSKVAINVGASRFWGTFDLSSQQVMRTDGSLFDNTSGRIEPFENGWFRISISGTANSTSNRYVRIGLNPNTDDPSGSNFVGDNFSGTFVWGVQWEEGFFPTSYIKTEGSQVTRTADSASITGENFSEWYRQDEGTVFVEYDHQTDRRSGDILRFLGNGGVDDNNISFRTAGGKTILRGHIKYNNDGSVVNFNSASSISDGINKAAFAFGRNDAALSITDFDIQEDASVTLPRVDKLDIGVGSLSSSSTQISNTTIKRLTYYPKRLPNAVLQALTKD